MYGRLKKISASIDDVIMLSWMTCDFSAMVDLLFPVEANMWKNALVMFVFCKVMHTFYWCSATWFFFYSTQLGMIPLVGGYFYRTLKCMRLFNLPHVPTRNVCIKWRFLENFRIIAVLRQHFSTLLFSGILGLFVSVVGDRGFLR